MRTEGHRKRIKADTELRPGNLSANRIAFDNVLPIDEGVRFKVTD